MSDHKIEKLIKIMDELREKCPWDKKQTIQSLRHLTIEEVYELSESIQNQNYDEIKKELGDLLLHIVFKNTININIIINIIFISFFCSRWVSRK